jgi:hypothetical protein
MQPTPEELAARYLELSAPGRQPTKEETLEFFAFEAAADNDPKLNAAIQAVLPLGEVLDEIHFNNS